VPFDLAIGAAVLAAQGVFRSEELRGTVLLGESDVLLAVIGSQWLNSTAESWGVGSTKPLAENVP
jgi:hypothetical protein